MNDETKLDGAIHVDINNNILYCVTAGRWGISQPLFPPSFAESIDACVDDVLRQVSRLESEMGWAEGDAAKERSREKILSALKERGAYDECDSAGIFMRLDTIEMAYRESSALQFP